MAMLNNQRVYSQRGVFQHSKSLELKSLVKFSGKTGKGFRQRILAAKEI